MSTKTFMAVATQFADGIEPVPVVHKNGDKWLTWTKNRKMEAREEDLEGRPHLVVPVVMLRAGVHAGSRGPLLYENEVLEADLRSWNHRPVVLNHPEGEGSVSACTAKEINKRKLGVLLNARVEKDALKAEAWLDIARMKKLAPDILTKVRNGKAVEVSTGLTGKANDDEGVWNGESYTGVIVSMQGDHLAILPDDKGACSVKDGCGLLKNYSDDQPRDDAGRFGEGSGGGSESKGDSGAVSAAKDRLQAAVSKSKEAMAKAAKAKAASSMMKAKQGMLEAHMERQEAMEALQKLGFTTKLEEDGNVTVSSGVKNKLSFSDTMQKLGAALQAKHGYSCYVTDVFDKFVVYSSNDGKMYSEPYTIDEDDTVVLDGPRESVERQTKYRRIRDKKVVNYGSKEKTMPMKKGPKGKAEDEEEEELELKKNEDEDDEEEEEEEEDDDEEVVMEKKGSKGKGGKGGKGKSTKNASSCTCGHVDNAAPQDPPVKPTKPAKPPTVDEFINSAPAELRGSLRLGMAAHNREKDRMIAVILENKGCKFTKEQLATRELDELQNLAELARGGTQETASDQSTLHYNYAGQGPVEQPVSNSEKPFLPPVMEFGSSKK